MVLVSLDVDAQSKKKYKRNKGTSRKEIRKRQQEAFEKDDTNAFNPKQPMGARKNDRRDDLLWHSETANTIYHGAANISLVNPSRYGLRSDLELSSSLLLNYWVPNLTLKKRWQNNNWYIASKHGLYSATPGFNWAQRKNHTSIIDDDAEVPFVLSMKNELIFSRLIMNHDRCGRDKPYIILSGGIGVDFGVSFGDSTLREIEGHFLTNRSPALTGSGYTAYAKLRADWQMNPYLILGGGFKYFRGDFSGSGALEHNADIQAFILPAFSVSAGYALSIANYKDESTLGIIPFLDLTWYIGKRQGRQKGLWGKKMF